MESAFHSNKEVRRPHIHPWLREIIDRRLKARKPGCYFLFHVDGKLFNYCIIQTNCRMEQMKSCIPYRGIHCLRHGIVTSVRRVGGMGLDSVIAVTGHKDLESGVRDSKIGGEIQNETSLKIVEHIKSLGLHQDTQFEAKNVIPL